MRLSNRLVLAPMATAKSEDGQVSQSLIDYYNDKSTDGAIGLIITEHAYISMDGKDSKGQLSISNDVDVEGLQLLTDTIHSNGSSVIAQINHAGSSTNPEITGSKVLGPSAIIRPSYTNTYILPKEMSIKDIERIVSEFTLAAKRAQLAGFDGVEIHSAHGYLLNQFYSPLTNQRNDAYGGDLSNRIRIHLEIIESIRKVVGEDYVIALRLGACDYMDGGSTLEDGVEACVLFEKAGVDLLDISGGLCGYSRPNHQEAGYFPELTIAIKDRIHIPVILTGGVTTAQDADILLSEEKADLIGVGRAILKDSQWMRRELNPSID